MKLANKIALITGGNTGIGRAVALAFAAEGADVAIAWIDNAEAAQTLSHEIEAAGRSAVAVHCDVTDERDVERLLGQVSEQLGGLDILVNNAGIQRAQSVLETSLESWQRMLAVHLDGAFLCSRGAAQLMMQRGGGRIINVCSQLGYIGREGYTAYSAAKGGLIAFTRALARELAPHAILVNGVAPGLVDTGFDPLPEQSKHEHAASLPLRRLATTQDLTPAFVFLAGEDGAYFCGQLLHPNGGEIMP